MLLLMKVPSCKKVRAPHSSGESYEVLEGHGE